MIEPVTDGALDAILAVQLTVAWSGEGRCKPPRLGWWDTDLIDEDGGGDFFKRLLPQTHSWASLEAVREAARRTDERARRRMAEADRLRTLFFLGFEVDEKVTDRLSELKRGGVSPASSLPLPLPLSVDFSPDAFAGALSRRGVSFDIVPGGRQILGARPRAPEAMILRMAAALVPLAERYPLPFYRWET